MSFPTVIKSSFDAFLSKAIASLWKTSKKSVVSITKKMGNTVTLKAKKKGTAVVTATYKKKKYKCKITVKKKEKPAADNPVLNSSDVTLYYLSKQYKDYITYDSSHLREYRFRVFGTKKEVRDWKITREDAWTKYNIVYGEQSYRLGFEDCVQIAKEHEIRVKGSVLSVEDMAHLVYMYDAVKKLNKLLLGAW